MENSKFHELCKAFGKSQQDFGKHQSESHHLAVEMVKLLKEYYQIPPSQFSLFRIDAQNEIEIVPPELINALTLRPDSLWQFGIGLTLCTAPESLPQELILIQILIRNDLNNKFFISYGDHNEEFEVEKGNDKTFYPFFDYLHSTVINTYNEKLHHFKGQSTKRKLGFEIKKSI